MDFELMEHVQHFVCLRQRDISNCIEQINEMWMQIRIPQSYQKIVHAWKNWKI